MHVRRWLPWGRARHGRPASVTPFAAVRVQPARPKVNHAMKARYTPASASKLLSRNLYVYGLGGLIAPFIGIKVIDLVVQLIPGMS